MTIIFRVDSSAFMGAGHVMRCLSLAHELKCHSIEVIFFCRDLVQNLSALIIQEGFKCQILSIDKEISNGIDYQTIDANQTISIINHSLQKKNINWIIVDHYQLDETWESLLKPYCQNLMVIDDLADRKHSCDLLLDQNLYPNLHNRYSNLVPKSAKVFFGPVFALLRNEFQNKNCILKKDELGSVHFFISFGGSDPQNLTELAIKSILSLNLSKYMISVVVGSQNTIIENLQFKFSSSPFIHFYQNPRNISDIMINSTIAIGAGGITTWERCCLGLPSICISVAENQYLQLKTAHENNLIIFLGKSETVTQEQIQNKIEFLLKDSSKLKLLNSNSRAVTDGLGVQRITNQILKFQKLNNSNNLSLRKATLKDMDIYFHWANEKNVRQYSYNPEKISYIDHIHWFEKQLSNTQSTLLVLQFNNLDVGQIRFEVKEKIAWIGFSIDEKYRGQGFSSFLLSRGTLFFMNSDGYSSDLSIRGAVMKNNKPSLFTFIHSGFVKIQNQVIKGTDSYIFEWPRYFNPNF